MYKEIRYFLIKLLPWVLVESINRSNKRITKKQMAMNTIQWQGDYSSWQEALLNSDGYDSSIILEKVKAAVLKVKNGEAVYERDSVLFDTIQYSWGLLAGLQKAALENNGQLSVLDFGGSLGSSYFQNRSFLSGVKNLEWSVIEQPHFVDCGNKEIADERLRFYHTIKDCLAERKPNVLLLSGVLQCVENPFEWIDKFLSFSFPYIIIDRTAFNSEERDLLTIQYIPENIYAATYPSWFLNKEKINKVFLDANYEIIASYKSYVDPASVKLSNGLSGTWEGSILKLKR